MARGAGRVGDEGEGVGGRQEHVLGQLICDGRALHGGEGGLGLSIEGDEDPNKRIRTSEILFTASKKVNNEQWESMFERLKDYKTLNGDCLVPKRYTIDPKLGTWVETQVRYAFRFGACHYWKSNQVRISSFLFPFFVCLLFTESPVQASPKGNRSDHWTRNRSTEQTSEHRAFAET